MSIYSGNVCGGISWHVVAMQLPNLYWTYVSDPYRRKKQRCLLLRNFLLQVGSLDGFYIFADKRIAKRSIRKTHLVQQRVYKLEREVGDVTLRYRNILATSVKALP